MLTGTNVIIYPMYLDNTMYTGLCSILKLQFCIQNRKHNYVAIMPVGSQHVSTGYVGLNLFEVQKRGYHQPGF